MKRMIRLLPLLILIYALPYTAYAETVSFTDLSKSHWAYRDICDMAHEGIIDGYPDGSFRPEEPVTYGEFIKMAMIGGRFKGEEDSGNGASNLKHWAKPYYDTGLNMFFYTGYDIRESALDWPIPRGYMALIAGSMLGDINIADHGDYSGILSEISDINSRTPYEHQIVKAYAAGVLAGYPDGTFRPAGLLTRGEAAAVISRLIGKIDLNAGNLPEPVQETENKEPLISIGSVLSSEPEGTLTFTIKDYGTDMKNQKAELLSLLKQYQEAEADELYEAFCEFADKEYGNEKQGMRKQYFGDHPVLMERILTTLRIFIFPEGWNNRFWETPKGEIYEVFY